MLPRGVQALVGILFAGLGAFAYWQFHQAQQVADYSAVASLASQAEGHLERFYCDTGTFPPSLDYLQFDFADTDGATAETLEELTYESDGQSYQLGFNSPNHDRIEVTGLPPTRCPRAGT